MIERICLLLLIALSAGCSSSEDVRVKGDAWVSLVITPRDPKATPALPADWWTQALKGAAEDPETAALLSRTYGVPVTLGFGTKVRAPEGPGLVLGVVEGQAEVLEGPLGKRFPILQRTFRVLGFGQGIHAHPERGAWRAARAAAKTPLERAVVDFQLGYPDTQPIALALEDYVRRALPEWRVVGNGHGPPFLTSREEHARYVEAASALYRKIAGWHDH